jgi:F420-dependent oxidoreductase-like protein
MRVSISLVDASWPGGPEAVLARLGEVARRADAMGLAALWLPDHLVQAAPGSAPDGEVLEAYTALGHLAARTERVGLGTMVAAATYRPPAVLIKAVTTLDLVSGGRAWLGIGAGYLEDEARAMGLPLPPARERAERLEDALRLAHHMWAGDTGPFEGRHVRLEAPHVWPLPVRRPHPPILIGGMGERRTLPLVARYGDACNLFDIPDGGATIRRKLEVLARACEEAGRPVDAIETTVSSRLTADEPPDAFAARCAALRELGIDHVVLITTGPWSDAALDVLEAAMPRVAGL